MISAIHEKKMLRTTHAATAVFALRDLDISNQANDPDDCSYDCCYHNCSPPLFITDSAFTGSLNSMLFIAFDIVIISTIQYFVNFYAV